MKIYDITQELFSANVYPGDKAPHFSRVRDMKMGEICNVTELEMNVHNGTHIDAPRHFVKNGKAIDELPLETLIGRCTVKTFAHNITAEDIDSLDGITRLLCRGKVCLTLDGAKQLSNSSVKLIGVEPQSIAPEDGTVPVHVEVLSHEIIALEGLVLNDVPDGEYFLSAAPLKLEDSDGAPCRAVLIEGIMQENL